MVSANVAAAKARRVMRNDRASLRMQWFGDQIAAGAKVTMNGRLTAVGQMLSDKMRTNVSIPVVVEEGPRGGKRVVERSKPGEFPRTQAPLPEGGALLQEGIFWDRPRRDSVRVGTTLDYGLILEAKMDRPFIMRTVNEELGGISAIMGAPIVVLPGVPQA